ncbi:stress-activated map kinase interacting protein 1-domain-containing protein [Lentinula raphanica]|uniref:Stress-activated map kinase interacting protein 1-domain-containing protein n=1 Tax=Lentinula raphanica TaxID=153919 RepID=A0AA38U9Q8_9AGAR|nr:stress-activated map kinase interacting protein 1-domain-containing protein [Lentinula raphanica]KAJ3756027.1 stress-activated map kinase interacting protein 1-domain-containing protein [Lentinula raphanica]KAJ3825133.1 stress-activated map kinase interacting protein 1-domain-containing protein [Lentinula raphanica]KAJ3834345.1 stress-activated map kinase interacting protein 1-domain-containing protein [Lentinula raphanica]
MSLISDTSYLIHSLRLSYLRDIEDPYGARIISLDPSYNSNPYICTAGLADDDRWPELDQPSSPTISEDEVERPLGFPGARLKHTQTIMGRRSGGLGLRVNAKRASVSKRLSKSSEVQNFIPENAPVQQDSVLNATSSAPVAATVLDSVPSKNSAEEPGSSSHPDSTKLNVTIVEPTVVTEAPVQKVVQFIPKFKGAAEMEARRRIRMAGMAARRGQTNDGPAAAGPPKPDPTLDDSSSEEEIHIVDDDSPDSDFDQDDDDSMDDGDEFDPDFAATRPVNSDSASDVSNSLPSVNSSVPLASSARPRLSPVSEGGDVAAHTRSAPTDPETNNATKTSLVSSRRPNAVPLSKSATHPTSSGSVSQHSSSNQISFTRKVVTPLRPLPSALTAMLGATSNSSNPFAELYAAISGRSEAAATNVSVFFPHAREPRGKAMELNVRKDATVEEVIGFALWNYWEEGWLPKLDEGIPQGEEGEKAREIRLSAIGWVLRLTEDDGEVDDDFPPPDRSGKIAKFNADGYAVIEATSSQVAQNQILESKIQRRPSRTSGARKPDTGKSPALTVPYAGAQSSSATFSSSLINGSVPLSTSLGPISSHGPQMFLRVRIADNADAVHVSTTIPVSSGMYMQEVLELVCRKRKIANSGDFALLLTDGRLFIPLDRTVASLQGKRELLLVKKSMLPQMGVDVMKAGRTTDPNASIFKRMSDSPEVKLSGTLDFTAAYKKYTIYRKLPMLVARQEKTLAIDGQYVHIMPSTNKAAKVFDSGRTISYHIKTIVDCQQSLKTPNNFKLVYSRAGGDKRYVFEAETPKLANEIVQTVKSLKAALERSSTVSKSRRSRHVGEDRTLR